MSAADPDVTEALEALDRIAVRWNMGAVQAKRDVETIRTVLARTQERAAQPGWRSIESAPKDGTHILGWYPITEEQHVVCFGYITEGEEGWQDAYGKEYMPPEAWMPLPPPPGAEPSVRTEQETE